MRTRAAILGVLGVGLFTSAAAAEPAADDPYFSSAGSWGQEHADQWALHRVGFPIDGGKDSPWEASADAAPVIVAVIDSGLDYFHPDLAPDSVWRNPREQPNGEDDDGNGFVDDLIGWDFVEGDNNPWDWMGHGTHVAGVIAAATNNGEGIAGVNPRARIMPLRVLNGIGAGRSTRIEAAVYYAVANGARVINLSMAVDTLSKSERAAVEYAHAQGLVVVAAAGNAAADAARYGPAAFESVVTVAATGPDEERAGFSNWGHPVDLAAPGVDILSLRARRSDIQLAAGIEDYVVGRDFVGEGARYTRASGTSFAAPFVSGVASLLLARDPELTPEQVKRVLTQSARDVGAPGRDRFTGYGVLDANAALEADPDEFIEVGIDSVAVVRGAATVVRVTGTADSDRFRRAWLEIGEGEDPESFEKVGDEIEDAVRRGVLGDIPVDALRGAKKWTLQVVTERKGGKKRVARHLLSLG